MIVWAIASMVVLGVLFGTGLVLAARAFHVDQDERIDEAIEILPGVNCGGCGYAGCNSYAEAVVEGEKITLCTAGGPEVAEMLADLMGVEVSEVVKLRAVVHCQGGRSKCGLRFNYVGEQDCRAAQITAGGPKKCAYGCLGLGSCAAACPYDAIAMSEDSLPIIDAEKCTSCGICVRTCPRDIISLLAEPYKVYLGCSVHERGKSVKEMCEVSCSACNLCVKKDPHEAIEMVDLLPVLDFEKGEGDFIVAAEVCPMNCFVVEDVSLLAAAAKEAEEPVEA